MSLDYTLHWITLAWRNKVLNEAIQNCFDKSIITGRTSQKEGQPEVLQSDDLYQSLASNLSGSA